MYCDKMKMLFFAAIALCVLLNYTTADNNSNCTVSGSGVLKISCQNGADINNIEIATIDTAHVHTLDMTHNYLTNIPRWICEFKNLVKLDLSHNTIKEIPHDIFQCGSFPNFPTMQIIDLSFNKIRRIPSGVFDNLVINALNINNNDIEMIEHGVFSKEHNFYHINCSYNQLTSLDSIFLQLLAQDPPWENAIYKRFDFSHNEIYKFHYTGFELDFSKVYNFHFNLQYNKFKYINLDLFRPFNIHDLNDLITLFSINGFLYIDFSNNPITCDCNMYETKTMLMTMLSFPYLPEIFRDWAVQSTVCMYPADVRGKPLSKLDDTQLICNITEKCPEKCTCIRKPDMKRLEVNCSSQSLEELPNSLPLIQNDNSELINLDMSGNLLSEIKNRSYLPNLGTFDVSSNRLNTIEDEALDNLNAIQKWYLHDNQFSTLPSKMKDMPFPNLSKLTLHGNQLVCDCSTVWLKPWLWALTEHKRLQYPRMITCETGDIIMEYDFNEDLCNINWGLVVGLPMLFLTLVAIGLITLYCFRNVIVLFIRKRREYKEIPEGKEYDVFVGYVTQDVMWIRNVLIPLLEPKYKLCIHNRDFEVGKPIVDNIANSIEKSQRSIMVLSPRFLESGWCKEEFLIAHRQYMLNPSQVLIPILLPDFDTTQEMPSHVKCYLQAHTYLKCDDPWFDKKIKDQMPKTSITEYKEEMNNQRHLAVKIDNNDDIKELNDAIPDAIRVSTISNGTVIPNILNGHIPNEKPQNGHVENGHIKHIEGAPNGQINEENIKNNRENIRYENVVYEIDPEDINVV
ncbi:unnamed protein product [Owenia fusiformis]|uniref:Uncharacterized protein n=1 Tax=Owenia fusiformis TaxID=6347 RepID=A0A8J1Y5L5_OWEFU|nr:unnamed protein product [Owenia fusiformis]